MSHGKWMPSNTDHCPLSRAGKGLRIVLMCVLSTMPTLAGCGDGTVTVRGHVLVDGQPATGGRLSLNPVTKGPRAFSMVTDEGEFALRASGGAKGAFPGQYRVFFQQPLDAATRSRLARELAGQLSVDELTLSYRSPRDKTVEIPETGTQDLVIDIRPEQGWTRTLND